MPKALKEQMIKDFQRKVITGRTQKKYIREVTNLGHENEVKKHSHLKYLFTKPLSLLLWLLD
jgi:hypothetical protein